jgi:periplasmic copper chaperone A
MPSLRSIRWRAVAFAAGLLLSVVATAHQYSAGTVRIGHPWGRATPPGAQVAGGYLSVTNTGTTADRLLEVRSAAADRVEMHEMFRDADIMRMRRLDHGLAVPAGKTITFAPGGYHLMFVKPARAWAVGDRIKATLVFEKAGKVDVEFAVGDAGATAPSVPHAGHRN